MPNLSFPSSLESISCSRLEEIRSKGHEMVRSAHELSKWVGLSDFVFEQGLKHPKWLEAANERKEELLDYSEALKPALAEVRDERQLWSCIRQFRNRHMLSIACLDLINQQDIETSLKAVSDLSDALILQTYHWLYQHLCDKYGAPVGENGPLSMMILGMGKLGGRELNFSSDIDLIFLYPEQGILTGGRKEREYSWFFTKLAQSLINALDQITADGRVFRVDMRLRPYGESGPLVMHFDAFENYLQEQGRDWERFAMVKARVLNEPCSYRDEVESLLRPFIYRKYLDFSSIEALRRMKNLITQEVRRRRLTNNIKLGAGGIREAEFIVQSLQLINGGKQASLRKKGLLESLAEIQRLKLMPSADCDNLRESYLFLRKVEHCLQQFADQQTQTLPDIELGQDRLAYVMSFESYPLFLRELEMKMACVNKLFGELIGEEEPEPESEISAELESLWLLDLEDEEAISVLQAYVSNEELEALWQAVKHFKQDAKSRVHLGRGKDILDKLMPQVFCHLFQQYQLLNEQEGLSCASLFERICLVMKSIIRRTAYLELMHVNQGVTLQLIKLCYASAWIAEQIAKFPMLLDELLNPQSLYHTLERHEYDDELRLSLLRVPSDDDEQQMEALRQFKLGQQLKVAAADVTGVLPVMRVSDHLTYLAEAILAQVVEDAWHQMVAKYGTPAGADLVDKAFGVIAYGKLGGIELGYGSDLDLVFVYQLEPNAFTDGEKSVENRTFYIKLAQRILHLFNTRTHSSLLYEVDMRLRPAGNSGLLVCHANTYAEYLQQEAWTWEHQALARSRVVYGDKNITNTLSDIRREILTTERESETLINDVVSMRQKMREHLSQDKPGTFDIKQGEGGLVDIEFLVQFWVLQHANKYPDICRWSDNVRILESLSQQKLISEQEADLLTEAYLAYRHKGHKLTLAGESLHVFDDELEQWRSPVAQLWKRTLRIGS
ncbi:bifunctional [glutamate--ammonia ligase]-adenylyl-L-tyrosine phosphorylase/[glutamate--ammonia-ligase] adenylyltransferase [Alteromonadaceae bacterium M269]|nr:bifunctional [glutamate--ammonia ligase]-adenylyl-L-tyrosine phosphorylase/[glutamate--ammonia-ligase] adenylyltransferase [Alteromonadaceae bacterium M269]